jgi:hypothetical protein
MLLMAFKLHKSQREAGHGGDSLRESLTNKGDVKEEV